MRSHGLILLIVIASGCASAGAIGRGPETARVRVKDFAFDPKKIEIMLGDTVEWVNDDAFTHSAVADGRSFDTGNIPADESRTFVPRDRGTWDYHCSWHPRMRGSIVVK
jgi:plastocyanin